MKVRLALALCTGLLRGALVHTEFGEGAPSVSRQTWDTESGLPQNTVQAILQTHDGFLWFATEGGLARFDSERFTIYNTHNTPQIRSNDVRALLEDASHTLWIGTADGITAFAGSKRQLFTVANGLPSNGITDLYEDGAHRLCANSLAGTACLDHDRFTSAKAVRSEQRIDQKLASFVGSPVLCSYQDHEGNTWIGTESSGVTILRTLPFEAFSDRSVGLDSQIRSVFRDRSGAIWFGTDSQGLTRFANKVFTTFTVADGLSSNVIVSLGQDASGDVLIGTPDGLNRLHNGTFTLTTSSEGLPDDFIRSIHTDSDGTVWVGTRRGLARLHEGHFQTFTHADGLGSDLIGSITRDHAGNLWIATLNGLSRLEGARFKTFTTAQGLSSNVITSLYSDHSGYLWIGTQGGGLNRYLDGSIQHVAIAGLPDVIYGITEDAHRNLWLASDRGIVRVTPNSEAVTYGVSDGLRVNECSGGGHPGIASTSDGGVWFATLKGAAFLRPNAVFNKVRPPVLIESLNIDNHLFDAGSTTNVPPGASRLAFSYAALSFKAPQKVEFRYRLIGFDKTWIEAGNVRTAFYTNLSPGNYSFHVIARNGDGVWNKDGCGSDFPT